MTACKDNIEKVSAYVDDELAAEERAGLEAHLESCDSCRSLLEAFSRGKAVMKEGATSIKAPESLGLRIAALIEREAARSSRPSFWRRVLTPGPAWAAASLVLLLMSGGIMLREMGYFLPSGEKPADMGLYIRDITHDSYLISGLPKRPFDVAGVSAGEVRSFLSYHVGFEVHVPDLKAMGYEFEGGRLWHTISRISALAVYKAAGGNTVSLFEVKKERIAGRGARKVVMDGRSFFVGKGYGYEGVAWVQKDVAFGMTGDLPAGELLLLARAAARQLAGAE